MALALRAFGLGDFLTGLPALSLLRQALPDHRIVLAAPAALAPLVDLVPSVDGLYARAELQPLDSFPETVDIGIDLHGKGPASRRLLSAIVAGAGHRIRGPGRRTGRSHLAAARTRGAEVVPVGPGIVRPGRSGRWRRRQRGRDHFARLPSHVPGGLTIVHPGAAAPARRWPADRFVTVARALIADGHHVVITGGPAEQALVQKYRECCRCGALARPLSSRTRRYGGQGPAGGVR